MKPKGFLKSVGLCLVLSTLFSSPTKALDSKYNRNGEVYVLIGDGSDSLKGIYRMNNAESGTIYASPIRYLDNNDVNNALGFTVDLNRHIYPFNETSSGWTQPEYIYRQVVDDVDYLQVDYGQHSYYHSDYRFCYAKRANGTNYEVAWCRGNDIYRSNTNRPSNNYIQCTPNCSPVISNRIDSSNATTAKNGAAKYSGKIIYSLGPGEYYGYSLPAGYKYVGTKVPIYSGKKWYKIKNNSWYTCWNTGTVSSPNYKNKYYWNKHSNGDINLAVNYFYWTVGEKESINTHVYSVEEYFSKNGDGFNQYNPQFHKLSTSNEVGRTSEVVVETFCRAGCLDGCGNANGGGTGSAERTISSVAFQPALKGSTTGDRRYFYARTNGQTDASIKLNGRNYNLSNVIGKPNSLNTEWIGISLSGANTDYVYAIGTDVIKEWYKIAANASLDNNHQITAVSVSNQWDEQGGIVFAYDDTAKKIYKFIRNEKAGTIAEFEVINCSDLASKIGSSNTEIDDIQADGFGSLFFGLSYPSKNMSSYNPTTKFKTTDAIHYHQGGAVMDGKAYSGCMLFRQNFSKVVFKRDYLSGIVSRINEIPYGYKFYHIPVTVPTRLVSSLSSNPSNWLNIINTEYSSASAAEKSSLFFVANHAPRSYINSSDFTSGLGSCGCSTYKNQAGSSQDNPGKCKLGVINIPTPPEVRHIGPYKVSYLDICGPYTSLPLPPIPNIERITNQGPGLSGRLQNSTLYFYMVENYPLKEEKAQDPRTTPDCDNDSRYGGFVSSICNPKPNSEDSNGTVYYEWKLWLVEDPKGNPCCELFDNEINGSNSFSIWYYTKGKFILTCRVKYKWYDYDLLKFGDTVSEKSKTIKTDYAWPSDLSKSYDMASASKRLNEIMNTSDFAFMQGNPKDIDGRIINYTKEILGDLNTDNKKNQYWAIQPIIVTGDNIPPTDEINLIASLERCDDLGEYKSKKYLLPNAKTKHGCVEDDYWYGVDPVTKEFIIEPDKKYYWRMALASQTNILYDISQTTNTTNRNASDFNIVAYMLSTPTIDGKENKLYKSINTTSTRFYPNQLGSCEWKKRYLEDGVTATYSIKVEAFLKYKLPNGTIKTEVLTNKINGDDVCVELGTSDIWTKNNPLTAYTDPGIAPPTDPLVGTISIRLTRKYKYYFYQIDSNGQPSGSRIPADNQLSISAEASVRFLDRKKPEIVYSETNPINLFGLTGRKLATTYANESRKNPEKVFFTISDNNTSEAANDKGITLAQHIENYIYNFGEAEAKLYCSNSKKMLQLYNEALARIKNKGEYSKINIKKRIEDAQKAFMRSSHLNYRPMFSKGAREVRLNFESSGINNEGKVTHALANQFAKYNTLTNKYEQDLTNDMFDSDKSYYTYSDDTCSIKRYIMDDEHIDLHLPASEGGKSSYLTLVKSEVVDNESGNGFHTTLKFSMPLKYIKLQNGTDTVPVGYANNTPGYEPYQFYVMATDCSGNYTISEGGKGYLPLNMALHVRDDIPPIPYGYVCDAKTNTARTFPQENGGAEAVHSSPFVSTEKPYATVIATQTANHVPVYVGSNWNENFLRQQVWLGEGVDGYITGSGNKYKVLTSLYPTKETIRDAYIGWGSNGKLSNSTIKSQLNKNVSPGYVEENVECTFKVFSSDNAGTSVATLSYMYITSFSQSTGGWSASHPNVSISSKFENPGTANSKMSYTTGEGVGVFVAPLTAYPLIMPIIMTAEDNARDWDYYTGYVSKLSETDSTKKSKIWGSLVKGASKPNKRRLNTSIVVLGSNTDIRTLDKTLKNEK